MTSQLYVKYNKVTCIHQLTTQMLKANRAKIINNHHDWIKRQSQTHMLEL